MAKGVLIHNPSLGYDDRPERHYHFPKQYLSRVERLVGDWILYYESKRNGGAMAYTAMVRLLRVRPDPARADHHYVDVEPGSYLPFARPVPPIHDGTVLSGYLRTAQNTISAGRRVAAVQPLDDGDFWRIVGLGMETDTLPREGEAAGMAEASAAYVHDGPRAQVTITRAMRDRAFRARVVAAYDSTCAFSGLRLVNGGGRAEVQAAHIRPVAAEGPDAVTNGLALSGTLHWMFDRGLLGLSEGGDILVSRQVNDGEGTARLLTPDRRAALPAAAHLRPHPDHLRWHRDHVFRH